MAKTATERTKQKDGDTGIPTVKRLTLWHNRLLNITNNHNVGKSIQESLQRIRKGGANLPADTETLIIKQVCGLINAADDLLNPADAAGYEQIPPDLRDATFSVSTMMVRALEEIANKGTFNMLRYLALGGLQGALDILAEFDSELDTVIMLIIGIKNLKNDIGQLIKPQRRLAWLDAASLTQLGLIAKKILDNIEPRLKHGLDPDVRSLIKRIQEDIKMVRELYYLASIHRVILDNQQK